MKFLWISSGHLLGLSGQVEAVPLPQFDQSLHVTLGLCSEAVGVDFLLQTETKRLHENKKPLETRKLGEELKQDQMSSEWLQISVSLWFFYSKTQRGVKTFFGACESKRSR